MLSLIDADVCVYRVGFTTQNDEEWVAKARFNEMVEGILAETNATEYQLWLSDKTSNNFRTKFYPEYKANRKDFVLPVHYHALKEHAIKEWGAQVAIEEEADDRLGILQTAYNAYGDESVYGEITGSIICSIDKDLLQVPGNHYNFVTKEHSFVTPEQGLKHFYTQLLTGDASDHIQGCPGVGPKRADKALAGCSGEESLLSNVVMCYRHNYRDKLGVVDDEFILAQILMNGICLKIRTYEGEIWSFQKSSVMGAIEPSSTAPMQVEVNLSTGLGMQSSPTVG